MITLDELKVGAKVRYLADVGDIPEGARATIVYEYGLGSYLIELENGKLYYAHSGELREDSAQRTIDVIVNVLLSVDNDIRQFNGRVSSSSKAQIDAALAMARGEG